MTGGGLVAWREAAGVTYLDLSDALGAPVRALFSTRLGGVSPPPFATLNLGRRTPDDPARVEENWRRFGRAGGFPPERVVTGEQVHGARVGVVRRAGDAPGACDALVTAAAGPVLAVLAADCVPIYIVSRRPPAVALAHAGWRGTLAGVGPAAAAALAEAAGVSPRELAAVIGPSIGPCCYPVGEEVAAAFVRAFGPEAVRPGEVAPRVDLWAANRAALLAAGLPAGQVHVAGLCTSCRRDVFFSHRAEGGRTGRMAAVAWIAAA